MSLPSSVAVEQQVAQRGICKGLSCDRGLRKVTLETGAHQTQDMGTVARATPPPVQSDPRGPSTDQSSVCSWDTPLPSEHKCFPAITVSFVSRAVFQISCASLMLLLHRGVWGFPLSSFSLGRVTVIDV